jgi:hypothetical protein
MDRYDNDGFKIADGVRADDSAAEAGDGSAAAAKDGEPELTVSYILKQIELIRTDTVYLVDTVRELGRMETGGFQPAMHGPIDAAGKAKAESFAQIVMHREGTNQKMLLFYENLLYGLTKLRPDDRHKPPTPTALPVPLTDVLKGVNELVKNVDNDSEMGIKIGEAVAEMLRNLHK